uniref:BACK domain-containing protein n=1 Tax=Tetranychus urticae TaxID=32264 RepID=T1JY88_TETUR
MSSLETDDKLTIVNRSMEHKISKELIYKIPYFYNMLDSDLLISKSAKLQLDFDEKALESVLKCVEFGIKSIDMENAINVCNLLDYFGIDNLLNDCLNYFHANFSIELLPIIIAQATITSKWINSSALNAFICRHFMKLVETTAWLCYPFETIEYICALDLMIYTERQVYNAIKDWVNDNSYFRKWYTKKLLQLVRWCHLKDEELSEIKKDLKFFTDLDPIFLDNKIDCDHIYNRTKQDYFIMIEELKGTDLRINILDDNLLPLISQVIKLDESISVDFFQDEHVSDIFFDSGRKRIRIDWCQSRYCFLDSLHNKTYHDKIYKYFITKYVFHATFLNNNIYMLTHDLEFICCRIFDECNKKTRLENNLNYENLLLTSKQSYDDRVILIDKFTKDGLCYNVKTNEWSSINLMTNKSSTGDQKESNKLLTLTAAFISMNAIRKHMNCKHN